MKNKINSIYNVILLKFEILKAKFTYQVPKTILSFFLEFTEFKNYWHSLISDLITEFFKNPKSTKTFIIFPVFTTKAA